MSSLLSIKGVLFFVSLTFPKKCFSFLQHAPPGVRLRKHSNRPPGVSRKKRHGRLPLLSRTIRSAI